MPGQGEQFVIYSRIPKTKNEDYIIKKKPGQSANVSILNSKLLTPCPGCKKHFLVQESMIVETIIALNNFAQRINWCSD